MEIKKMYIDGEWTEGTSGKLIDSINPATGEVIAQVYESSLEDTNRAIAAAKKSFYITREWRDMDSQQRGDILLKIADTIEKYLPELAKLDAIDTASRLERQRVTLMTDSTPSDITRALSKLRAEAYMR